MRKIYTAITMLLFSVSVFALETEFVSAQAEQATPTDITEFTIDGQVGDTEISTDAKTVLVKVPVDTDVTALVPSFTLSEGAEVYVGQVTATDLQVSGETAQNFTSPVEYIVVNDGAESVWTVTVEEAVAVSENALEAVSMYPNPVTSVLTISNLENVVDVTVMDITGRAIEVRPVSSFEMTISTEAYKAGIYLVSVRDANNNIRTERIVKK